MKKIINQKRWVYTLYSENDLYILNVPFCNGSVDFSRDFQFNEMQDTSDEYLIQLSSDIVNNYEKYKHLEII